MPGPREADEALAWIKEAFFNGRYRPSVHFAQRLLERNIQMPDVHYAIVRAEDIIAYTRTKPRHGGTCWRVAGPSLNDDDDELIVIGVEAYLDRRRRRVIVCTVFRKGEE
jgi:hypothetical protein